jgi:Ras-related protein Rab-21
MENFKVVLLGESNVGKTSILLRYTKNEFSLRQEVTVQTNCIDKIIYLTSTSVKLSIWDTAGSEKYNALAPLYYRDADGAILVYDVTEEKSFDRIKYWVNELKKVVGHEIKVAIVGNKIDKGNRILSDEDATKSFY